MIVCYDLETYRFGPCNLAPKPVCLSYCDGENSAVVATCESGFDDLLEHTLKQDLITTANGAYDAAVIERTDRGKVKIVKKHETPTRVGGVLGGGVGLATGVVIASVIAAFAAGAVEYDNGVALAPTGARHLSGVGATTVGWDAMLLADSARSVGSALDAVVAWFGALAPDTATATMTTSAAGLAWSAVLAPDFSLLSTGGTAPALAELWALAPDSALHAVTDTGVVPIPESVAALIRTLLVSGELRIVHVPAS